MSVHAVRPIHRLHSIHSIRLRLRLDLDLLPLLQLLPFVSLSARQLLPAFSDRARQVLEHLLRIVPADAGVRDGNTVLEASFAFGGDFLVAWNRKENRGWISIGTNYQIWIPRGGNKEGMNETYLR